MVSFYSKGRFANFHFIAAAAYVYSLKHGLEFHVPDKSNEPHLWPVYLQEFSHPNWNPSLLTVEVNDGRHSFVDLPFKEEWRDKNIIIGTRSVETGYFQSYKYMQGYEKEIVSLFQLFNTPTPNVCALHFRGGDYVAMPDRHPVITSGYIRKAIYTVLKETACDKFVVYTDDLNTCIPVIKEAIKGVENILDVVIKLTGDEISNFKDIHASQYIITANSSYSVLAAILNTYKNSLVVCPHENNYFGPMNKHLDVSTLYPPEWIRIKY